MTIQSVPQYNGRPIAVSQNPVTLTRDQADYIEQTFTNLLKDVEDFTSRALKDRGLLKEINIPEDLDSTPTPLGLHIPFARFDFLFDGKEVHGLELNTDGTSGFNIA